MGSRILVARFESLKRPTHPGASISSIMITKKRPVGYMIFTQLPNDSLSSLSLTLYFLLPLQPPPLLLRSRTEHDADNLPTYGRRTSFRRHKVDVFRDKTNQAVFGIINFSFFFFVRVLVSYLKKLHLLILISCCTLDLLLINLH